MVSPMAHSVSVVFSASLGMQVDGKQRRPCAKGGVVAVCSADGVIKGAFK